MKKIDFALTVLVVGTLAYNVPTTWASEIASTFSGNPRGVSAQDTFMRNPGTQAFARSSAAVGRVVSVNTSNNEIVIRDEFTGEHQAFTSQNPEALVGLVPGARVRIHDSDFRQGASLRASQNAV